MPPRVNLEKCNGCEGRDESFCEEVCPGNLMAVGEETGKAYCRCTTGVLQRHAEAVHGKKFYYMEMRRYLWELEDLQL
jgi:NAD-dependent dihydropyrimidine dehydrogenase PreA subunit